MLVARVHKEVPCESLTSVRRTGRGSRSQCRTQGHSSPGGQAGGEVRGGAQAGMLSLLCEQSSGALSAFPREQTVTSDSDQASPVCHLQEALLTPFTDEETEAQGHTP